MLLLFSSLPLAAWVYLLAFRGRFWSSSPVLPPAGVHASAHVAVVVPARNEAESIAASLRSLLAQEFAGGLSVILVDDNSTEEPPRSPPPWMQTVG